MLNLDFSKKLQRDPAHGRPASATDPPRPAPRRAQFTAPTDEERIGRGTRSPARRCMVITLGHSTPGRETTSGFPEHLGS